MDILILNALFGGTAAALAAILHVFPVTFPFFAPGEGALAVGTDLGG